MVFYHYTQVQDGQAQTEDRRKVLYVRWKWPTRLNDADAEGHQKRPDVFFIGQSQMLESESPQHVC